LSLTSGGRIFFKEVKLLLQNAAALHDVAADIAEQVRGPLAIGCLLTFAQIVLPELRRTFEDQFPEVRIRQYERHQAQIFEMLQRSEIDLALTYDLGLPQDVQFEPLVELPPYVMLPEGHALARAKSVTLEQLADEPMILLDLPFSRDYFLSVFHQRDIRPRIAERTADIATMRSMVANGFGYGIANMRPVNQLSPDGKPLCFVPLESELRPLMLGIASPISERRTRTIQAFTDHCRAFARTNRLFKTSRQD
jgi:DNA-binding transcriptional LysR family regulator